MSRRPIASPGRCLAAASAILVAATLPGCGDESLAAPPAAPPPAPLELARDLEPCTVRSVRPPTECGSFAVYEDPEAGAGRVLDLDVLVVRALSETPEPDPVVLFQGGPGGSTLEAADFLTDALSEVRARRDLVFIDQRGTGGDHRLSCPGPFPGGAASQFGVLFPPDHLDACRQSLEARADLTRYTTPAVVDDIAAALQWLGYTSVNLYGASYGTRPVLVFLRRHPAMVRTAVVNSVAPPNRDAHLWGARNAQRSLDVLFTRCENDAACAEAFGDVRSAFSEVVEGLRSDPVDTRVDLPGQGPAVVPFGVGDFGYAVRGMLYGALTGQVVPWTRDAAETGDLSRFANYFVRRAAWVGGSFATGMHLSVLCSEDVAGTGPGQVDEATAGTFLGDTHYRRYQAACARWPTATLPAGYREPVSTPHPVLVISGNQDPVTPPTWGDEVAGALPGSVHVVVPGAGHVPMGVCVRVVQAQFIRQGTVDGLDLSCLSAQ